MVTVLDVTKQEKEDKDRETTIVFSITDSLGGLNMGISVE